MSEEKLKPDEYLEEATGQVRCKRCGGLRRGSFPLFGTTVTVPILCPCQQETRQRREEILKKQEFRDRIQRYRTVGMTEPALLACTFQNDRGYNREALAAAEKYAEHWQEMASKATGLLFWGGVGTGKTYLAACIANCLLDRGICVRMTNFSRILNRLTDFHAGDRNQFLDELNRAELLILDDLGMERNSEFAQEQIFNVIDSRYRSRRPLIITTNLSLEDMKHPQTLSQARIFDRILERCIPVCVSGKSIRKEKAAENLKQAKALLR